MFLARLAERGLKPKSYDEQVLTLRYDRAQDTDVHKGDAIDLDDLSRYASDVLHGLPGGDTLFPRLQEIRIDVSGTD